jgi:hypothetical protein
MNYIAICLVIPFNPLIEPSSLNVFTGLEPGVLRLNHIELTIEPKSHGGVRDVSTDAVSDELVKAIKT